MSTETDTDQTDLAQARELLEAIHGGHVYDHFDPENEADCAFERAEALRTAIVLINDLETGEFDAAQAEQALRHDGHDEHPTNEQLVEISRMDRDPHETLQKHPTMEGLLSTPSVRSYWELLKRALGLSS